MRASSEPLSGYSVTREVLEQVLQVEEKARTLIRKAEKQGEEIIQKAKVDARVLATDSESALRELRQSSVEKKKKQLSKKAETIIEKAKQDSAALEKSVASKKQKVQSIVLDMLEKRIKNGGLK